MSTITDPTSLLAPAVRAVRAACAVTRSVQHELDQIRQMTKDDRSPVTVADFAAQAIVALSLYRELGEVVMIGEESTDELRAGHRAVLREAVTHAVRQVWPEISTAEVMAAIDLGNHDASGARYWTLDPVDGTKGFLRGGQYAISLAWIDQGEVTLGVLGCPNLSRDYARAFNDADPQGCLYYATRDGGAWYSPADDAAVPATRIQATRGRPMAQMRVCESVEASHSKQDDTVRITAYLNAHGAPAQLDSQCKYAVVARGQAEAYLRLPTWSGYVEKIWDHAAGKLVAEEAGAVVTDIQGKPLDFSYGATLSTNQGVVCASPEYHSRIMEAIKALRIG